MEIGIKVQKKGKNREFKSTPYLQWLIEGTRYVTKWYQSLGIYGLETSLQRKKLQVACKLLDKISQWRLGRD